MKKTAIFLICILFLCVFAGCGKTTEGRITFTATIEEVYDNSLLVSTLDDVGFDIASVSYAKELKYDFNFVIGQTVKITILPEIRESYPVQITATKIELIQ